MASNWDLPILISSALHLTEKSISAHHTRDEIEWFPTQTPHLFNNWDKKKQHHSVFSEPEIQLLAKFSSPVTGSRLSQRGRVWSSKHNGVISKVKFSSKLVYYIVIIILSDDKLFSGPLKHFMKCLFHLKCWFNDCQFPKWHLNNILQAVIWIKSRYYTHLFFTCLL